MKCKNCKKRASYGLEGGKAEYCKEHAPSGTEDVINKRCEFEDCKTQPSYGKVWKKPTHCKNHKDDDMKDVINKHCKFDGCQTQPSYGKVWKKPTHCYEHKDDDMKDVVHKHCKSPHCETRVQSKYKGYCCYCFVNLFPEEKLSKNYKTKEIEVQLFLKSTFPNQTFIFDKAVSNVCKKRPDVLITLQSHAIIIEVDEHKHEDYECICENRRMMEISEALNHKNIVFIRFNPDSYTDENGKKIKSCFTENKQGLVCVDEKNKKMWNNRLNSLKDQLTYWLGNKPEKQIETVELFY